MKRRLWFLEHYSNTEIVMRNRVGFKPLIIIRLLALAFFSTLPSTSFAGEVSVGDTYESVIEILGNPESEMNAGEVRVLTYEGRRLRLIGGRVVKMDRIRDYALGVDESMSKKPVRKPYRKGQQSPKILEIRRDGALEPLQALIVPGKVTIIDFFADWCGPCKVISPKLVDLATGHPDVYLRKVDIVNWNTPIVKQIGIKSIPKVLVFDKSGHRVGPATSSYSKVAAMVRRASAS